MVLFTIFCPIVAAGLIMPWRAAGDCAGWRSVLTFAAGAILFASLDTVTRLPTRHIV